MHDVDIHKAISLKSAMRDPWAVVQALGWGHVARMENALNVTNFFFLLVHVLHVNWFYNRYLPS